MDAGFSFTHALPLFEGQLLLDGVRRINLGGKALTNFFKELVSYRWGSLVTVCTIGGVINMSPTSTKAYSTASGRHWERLLEGCIHCHSP